MPDAVQSKLDRAVDALREASKIGEGGGQMLHVALRLVQGGWPVFPCGLNKAPLVAGGFRARSASVAQVKDWWKTHPDAMPALCPGDQGLAALDVDTQAAYDTVGAEHLNGNFIVQTGGTSQPFGLVQPHHLYVQATAQPKIPGVVTRYQAGYVIAPGARRGERVYKVMPPGLTPDVWHGLVEGVQDEATTLPAPADAPPFERVAAAVALIPNNEDVNRDQYVAMAHMIKGSMGDEGLPIFLEWAAKYPGADPGEDTRVFETIRTPKLGWLTLASRAATFGFDAGPEIAAAAQDEFAESPLPSLEAMRPTQPTPDADGPDVGKSARERLMEMLTRVKDAKDDFDRALALLALRKSGFGAGEIRGLVGGLVEREHSDEGNTLGELLRSPELLVEPAPAIPMLAWPGLKTLLAAREKAGKSTFALAGAAAATRGGEFLGQPTEPQRVLWLTEESLQIAVQRAEAMQADHDRLIIVPMGLNPRDQLQQAVERWSPQIVVVDTLYRFAGVEDENDAVAWMPILLQFDEITRAGIALLILAHANKTEKGGYRGSSAIGGFVDAILEMKNPSEGDTTRKYAGRGRLSYGKPFTVQMLKDGQFTLFNGAPKDTREQKVLSYLKSRSPGGTTRRIINRDTGIKYEELMPILESLLLSKQVTISGEIEPPKKKGGKPQDLREWHAIAATDDFAEEV